MVIDSNPLTILFGVALQQNSNLKPSMLDIFTWKLFHHLWVMHYTLLSGGVKSHQCKMHAFYIATAKFCDHQAIGLASATHTDNAKNVIKSCHKMLNLSDKPMKSS